MGRIRPTYIKRVSIELLNKYPQAFSKDFEANKEMVSTLTDVSSVKMRNRINFRSNSPRGVAWISCEIADLLTRVRIPARAPSFSLDGIVAEFVVRNGLNRTFCFNSAHFREFQFSLKSRILRLFCFAGTNDVYDFAENRDYKSDHGTQTSTIMSRYSRDCTLRYLSRCELVFY